MCYFVTKGLRAVTWGIAAEEQQRNAEEPPGQPKAPAASAAIVGEPPGAPKIHRMIVRCLPPQANLGLQVHALRLEHALLHVGDKLQDIGRRGAASVHHESRMLS